jgi:hypothetical protein
MAYNRIQAGKLLTAAEMDLFNASLADRAGKLGARELEGKLRRARTLRDKYRDLFQRQSRATRREKAGRAPVLRVANERTERKARIFEEVMERFERRLEKLRASEARAAARLAATSSRELTRRKRAAQGKRHAARKVERSPKAPSRGPKAKRAPTMVEGARARGAAIAQRFAAAGAPAIRGHVSSKGRRRQARRDG